LPAAAIEASLGLIHEFRRVADVSTLTNLLRSEGVVRGA